MSAEESTLNPPPVRAAIWGPQFWFFLHTVSMNYPLFPNKITKKKYYDLVMNFPLFIPDAEMAGNFSKLLDKYPVSPYLDSRESFIKWVHFIHNRVNEKLYKPVVSYEEFFKQYYEDFVNVVVQPDGNVLTGGAQPLTNRHIGLRNYFRAEHKKYYFYAVFLAGLAVFIWKNRRVR
jgi:hypothetical protein